MTWIRFVLKLYFFMVAHRAACQTLSKAPEVYENRVEVLLALEIFLTKNAKVKDLLCLWFQSVQYDLQHDFAWVTDEAYCLVFLALLQVAFLGKCDD